MAWRTTGAWIAILGMVMTGAPAAASSGAEGPADASMATLKGTVWYRERMLLPPNAEITVRLENDARMDVAAEVIATTRVTPQGGPPYAFELSYDPALIEATDQYAVRARIEADGSLLFISKTRVPAFAGATGEPLEIMVSRVAATAGATPSSASAITGIAWKLIELQGQSVASGAGEKRPDMTLDDTGRVSGFSGCNRFMGGYLLSGGQLSFSQLASTMMACQEGMELEQRFLRALARTVAYQVAEGELALLDEMGTVILRFETSA